MNLKQFCIISLLVIMSFLSPSAVGGREEQSKSKGLSLIPNWKKGDKQTYVITKTRKRSVKDSTPTVTTARINIEVEVLEVNKQGYVISWIMHKPEIIGSTVKAPNDLVENLQNSIKNTKIILELSPACEILGIRNWRELQKLLLKQLDIITKVFSTAGKNESEIKKIRSFMNSMFSSKEQIVTLYTGREIGMFFFPIGWEFPASNMTTYDDLLANPFGGEPFPTVAVLSAESVGDDPNLVEMNWNQQIKPGEAKRIMTEAFKQMSKKLGIAQPPKDVIKEMSVKDNAKFFINISSGWIEELTHTRTSKVDGNFEERSTQIKRTTHSHKQVSNVTIGYMETVSQFFDHIRTGEPEKSNQLIAQFPSLPRDYTLSTLNRLSESMKSGQWNTKVLDGNAIGDVAVIVFNECTKNGKPNTDIDPAYLVKQKNAWRILPKLTSFSRPYFNFTPTQIQNYQLLEKWYKTKKTEYMKSKL